jgi:hypothetical protein
MYWRIVFAFAGIKRDDDADYRENKPECPPNTRAVYKVEEWAERKIVVRLRTDGTVADYRVRLPRLRLSNKIEQRGTRDKIGIRKDDRRGSRRLEGGGRR